VDRNHQARHDPRRDKLASLEEMVILRKGAVNCIRRKTVAPPRPAAGATGTFPTPRR
jgi:hypothetical protein